MKHLIKIILIIVLICAALFPVTYTKNDLIEMGCFRIGDLVKIIGMANYTSVDNYHFNVDFLNHHHQNSNQYKIFIDDHLYSANVLEGSQLNWIPMGLSSVDSIVLIDKNSVYKGEFLQDGAIQVYTHKAKKMLAANLSSLWGNESGDPGPYKYTPYKTKNIDKIGRNQDGFLSLNIDDKIISGFGNYRQHTYTDDRIYDRIDNNLDNLYWLGMDQFGIGEMVSLENHSLILSHSYGENAYYFHPLYHTEVPANLTYDHASYAGSFSFGKNKINIRSNYEKYRSEYIQNNRKYDLDWLLNNFMNGVEFVRKNNLKILKIGIKHTLNSSHDANENEIAGYIGYTRTRQNKTRQFDFYLKRNTFRNEANFHYKLAYNSHILFYNQNKLTTNFYIYNFSSYENFDYKWRLSTNYYTDINDYYRITLQCPEGITAGFQSHFDIDQFQNFSMRIGLPMNLIYNYLNRNILILDESEVNEILDDKYIFDNYSEVNFGLNIKIEYSILQSWKISLFNQYLLSSFSDEFSPDQNVFYHYKFLGSLHYQPSVSFSGFIKLTYWKNNFQEAHFIRYPKNQIVTIDATFIKYFLQNRVSMTLTLKNLLNSRYWLDQSGMGFDRSMYFGVNFWL